MKHPITNAKPFLATLALLSFIIPGLAAQAEKPKERLNYRDATSLTMCRSIIVQETQLFDKKCVDEKTVCLANLTWFQSERNCIRGYLGCQARNEQRFADETIDCENRHPQTDGSQGTGP